MAVRDKGRVSPRSAITNRFELVNSPMTLPATDETDDNSEFLEPVGRNSAPVSRLGQRPNVIVEETKTIKKVLT